MPVTLHPRATAPGRIQVWVGVFGRQQLPQLSWLLNGSVADFQALRPLASARTPVQIEGNENHAFTGVYELQSAVDPAVPQRITVNADGESATLTTFAIPHAVPGGIARFFNVMMVSCFFAPRDPSGFAGQLVRQLPIRYKPHMTILMGDQIYLDLPALKNFPNEEAWLARKFEGDYTANWTLNGYQHVLAAAPSVSTADDHEYWNNYPHPAVHVGNTLTSEGRARWERAARALYEAFQLPLPSGYNGFVLDVDPLSFFVLDTRSFRAANRTRLATPDAMIKLDAWFDRLITQRKIGILVTGQSLFEEKTSRLGGTLGDRHLADYGDYDVIVQGIDRAAANGATVLCLTGDVHWGRIVRVKDVRTGRHPIYEIISSPTSLVASPAEVLDRVKDSIRGFLGRTREPFPLHGDPKDPPVTFAKPALPHSSYACEKIDGVRGNHFTILSFRRQGTSVEMIPSRWTIVQASSGASVNVLDPISLNLG